MGSFRETSGEGALLRAELEELERTERSSASAGERRAAEWLVERFAMAGAEARLEAVPAHGTYWWRLSESAVRHLGERWLTV